MSGTSGLRTYPTLLAIDMTLACPLAFLYSSDCVINISKTSIDVDKNGNINRITDMTVIFNPDVTPQLAAG